MTTNISVERMTELPQDLEYELAPDSNQEGFRPVELLRRDWVDGRNRFDEPGEAFYTARSNGRLVGICGLNRDPYGDDASIGRLRRLYVIPAFRRRGVGSSLVRQALKNALDHFAAVRLRTLDNESAQFFEALGFQKVESQKGVTHEIRFDAANLPSIMQSATPHNLQG